MLAILIGPEIAKAVSGTKDALVVCGLGGSTSSGVSPVVAGILQALKAHTFFFGHMPFRFEGKQRTKEAGEVLELLEKIVDSFHIFQADEITKDKSRVTLKEAYEILDEALCNRALGWLESRGYMYKKTT